MKKLMIIALGVALGIAGYVLVNRYLQTHSATVVVQRRASVNADEEVAKAVKKANKDAEQSVENS